MKISQAEARRLKAKVKKLEAERRALFTAWRSEHLVDMVYIGDSVCSPTTIERIRAVRWVGHPVTISVNGDRVEFYATKETF